MRVAAHLHKAAVVAFLLWIGWGTPTAAQERVVVEIPPAKPGAAPHFDTVRVHRGDEVIIRWSSDTGLELHLHGYDLTGRARRGEPAELRFLAVTAGRFPVEAHLSQGHRRIGYIEVYPR